MPFVAPFIAAGAGWFAGTTLAVGVFGSAAAAFAVAQTVLWVGLSVGLSYVSTALAPKPNLRGLQGDRIAGISGAIRTGGVVGRSFIAGRYGTVGSLVYRGVWGTSTGAPGWGTPNAYYVRVVACSDLPSDALVEIWVNGERVTVSGSLSSKGTPVTEYNVAGVDHLWVKFYDGTQSVADSYLTDKFGADPDFPWTANHKGIGVTYVIFTALVNPELFSGFPEYRIVVDGIAVYDQRLDSTSNGYGSHRYATAATWEHSRNPMVILNHLMRGYKYNGEWVYGPQKVVANQLPSDSWFAGMNECEIDTEPSTSGGATVDQYRCGAEVPFDMPMADLAEELLKACNGRMAEIGGIYKIRVGAAGAAVFDVTDDDLVVTSKQSFDPVASLQKTINGIAGNYPEPEEGWVLKPAPMRLDSDLEDADDGRELVADVTYGAVADVDQVQRLMQAALLEARKFRSHVVVFPPALLALEPLDAIAWTSSRNGYISKLFDVPSMTILGSLDVVPMLREVDPADYDFDPDADYMPESKSTLVISRPDAQGVADFAVEALTLLGDDGRELAAIRMTWTGTADDVVGLQFEIRRDLTEVVVTRGETYNFASGQHDVSHNIRSDTDYEVRARLIPGSPREVSWTAWLPVTTDDVRIQAIDVGIAAIVTAALADNAVTAQKILNGEITVAKFASGIAPPTIETSLPSSGNYEGRLVYLTTDDKLYRYTGSAWTAAVPTSDLSGQITTTQITDLAVTTPKVAATAITGAKIAAGEITASHMVADTLTAGTIAAGAIGSSEIAALAIVAGKIAANAVASDEIAANAIVAGKIAADAIIADKIIANAIITSKINDLAVTTGKIGDNAVSNRQSETITYTSDDNDISTWVTLESITKNYDGGTAELLAVVQPQTSTENGYAFPGAGYRIQMDGSTIGPGEVDDTTLFAAPAPSVASHTYTIQMNRHTAGSPFDDDHYDIEGFFRYLELKK